MLYKTATTPLTTTTNYTLIACLPDESEEILTKNGITILTPTLKPPAFQLCIILQSSISICGGMHYIPLSFIVNFSNLQERKLSFNLEECLVDFEKLQDVIFPKLQV
uniref:Uncharacterized protein n=1 Tax=Rhizophagus irregularis (strain DAOM 181602 / DAOM 197198 / MUCL 43194) TaxID=747089 RepID=U9UAP1_RHIID